MRCVTHPLLVLVVLLAGVHICTCTSGDEPPRTGDPAGVGLANATGTRNAVPSDSGTENGQVHWIDEYDEARLKGIEQSKPVLMFVTSDNCAYCRKMYSEAFRDHAIISELQQKFVPAQLKLDPRGDLARQLRITMYPTTLIINPDGTIVDYARGFLSADDLRARMARVTTESERVAALPVK